MIVCDTEADPVQTQQCAQRAVDDRVVAVVGMSVLDSDPVWPLLEAAGIPVIGSRINTDRDVSSPVAFPLGSGIVGTFSAMPQLLARQGAHKVAVVMSDFGAATSSALGLIESGLSRTSASAGPVVRVPLGVKSLAPYAAAATRDEVDGVIVFLERKEQAGLLRSLKAANFRGRIVTQASLSITGNPAIDDGTLGVGEFPPVNARGRGMKLFRSDMADAGISSSGLLGLDAGALNFWLAAWVFERVAQGLPAIDSRNVAAGDGQHRRTRHGGRDATALDLGPEPGVSPPLQPDRDAQYREGREAVADLRPIPRSGDRSASLRRVSGGGTGTRRRRRAVRSNVPTISSSRATPSVLRMSAPVRGKKMPPTSTGPGDPPARFDAADAAVACCCVAAEHS